MKITLTILAFAISLVQFGSAANADETVFRALIIDGQNNHKWKETTPLIQATLEASGRFKVMWRHRPIEVVT
ncbi:MAG: hypothetical protein R3C53_14360 [Pirellulaceae bacterium]